MYKPYKTNFLMLPHILAAVKSRYCIYASSLKRFQSTATTEEGTETTAETEKPKSWFIRWLHGEIPEQKVVRTENDNLLIYVALWILDEGVFEIQYLKFSVASFFTLVFYKIS